MQYFRYHCTMKYIFALLLLIAYHTDTFAQQHKIDSLQKCLPTAKLSEKATIHLQIGQAFNPIHIDSALVHLQKAEKLATQYSSKEVLGEIYGTLGRFYADKQDLVTASTYYEKAIAIFQYSTNQKLYARYCYNLGIAYAMQGKYTQSLQLFQIALDKRRALKDPLGEAQILVGIALVHRSQNNLENALSYYQKAGEIAENIADNLLKGQVLHGMGFCYYTLKDYAQALVYYEKSTVLFQENGRLNSVGTTLLTMGYAFNELKNKDKALEYYQKSIAIFEKIKDNHSLTNPLVAIARLHYDRRNLEESYNYIKRALQLAQENSLPAEAREAYGLLFEITKKQGKYQESLAYLEKHLAVRDSLLNIDKIREFANLETKFQVKGKQGEIDLLAKDKLLLDKENGIVKVEKESQRLYALAERETNRRKADSLTNLAQKAQLKEQKIEAEAKTKQALQNQTVAQQRNALYILAITIGLGTLILLLIARSRQAQQKTNRLLQTKNTQIQQLNQWKDKIFATIAHDLRSPLTAMQGVSMQIDAYIDKDKLDKVKQIGTAVEKNTATVTAILDNLLHWAMLQTQQITLVPQNIYLHNFVQTLTVGKSQIQNLVPTDWVVHTDETALAVILRNFLSNALKFTPTDGHILVTADRQASTIVIAVTNTSEGIAPEKLETLFAQKVASQDGLQGEKGKGMGLMLCQAFAEKMNAELTVQNNEGQTTTFSVRLPI